MKQNLHFHHILLFAFLFWAFPTLTHATVYTVSPNNAQSSRWIQALNWSPSYPGLTIAAGDEVIVNTSQPNFRIDVGDDVVINGTLTIQGTTVFDIEGSLTINGTIQGTADFNIEGNLTINGTINNPGRVNPKTGGTYVHNSTSGSIGRFGTFLGGTITINSGKTLTVTDEAFLNGAIFNLNGTLKHTGTGFFSIIGVGSASYTIPSGGRLECNKCSLSASPFTISSGATVTGNIAVGSNKTLVNNGTITLASGNTLDVASTTATFTNNGTCTISGGTFINDGATTINNNKTLTINSNGHLEQNGTMTVTGKLNMTAAKLTLAANKTLTLPSTSKFTCSVNSTINGSLVNNGTVTVNSNKTLTIASGGSFTQGKTCTVNGTLSNSGTVTVNSSKTLLVNSAGTFIQGNICTVNGKLNNNGTVTVNSNKTLLINSAGTFTHSGTATTINGTLTNKGKLKINRTLTIESGGTLVHQGVSAAVSTTNGRLINKGTFTLNQGETMTVANVSRFIHNGSAANINGALNFSGTSSVFNVESGKTLTIGGSGEVNLAGTVLSFIINDGTITNNGKLTMEALDNNGSITNNGECIFNTQLRNDGTYTNAGTTGGNGTFTGDFTNPVGAILAPGTSPGCTSITGDFTNDGTLSIEIEGTTECSGHDKVNVTGTVNLSGILTASDSYAQSNGDQVTIIDAAALNGTFTTVNLPTGWFINYNHPNVGEVTLSFGALPVELTSFSAKEKDGSVTLDWATASEKGNRGFEIQHSINGSDWSNIGFVAGAGTTLEEQVYRFVDTRPETGTNYYRLRQEDFDGHFEFSNIVSVQLSTKNEAVKVFPNPVAVGGGLTLEFPSGGQAAEGSYNVVLYNLQGQQIRQAIFESGTTKLDLAFLSAGTYLLRITDGREVWQERVVLQ